MKTSTRTKNRRRLTAEEREAAQDAALDRAQNGRTNGNDLIIIAEFAARGITAHPRKDVFTFNAWKALHRHVRKGEHGVRVAVYVHTEEVKDDGTTEGHSYPTSATVFHVSQTDPDEPHPGEQPTPAPIANHHPAPVTVDLRDGQCWRITPTADPYRPHVEQVSPESIPQDEERDTAEDQHESELLQQEQDDEARADNGGLF